MVCLGLRYTPSQSSTATCVGLDLPAIRVGLDEEEPISHLAPGDPLNLTASLRLGYQPGWMRRALWGFSALSAVIITGSFLNSLIEAIRNSTGRNSAEVRVAWTPVLRRLISFGGRELGFSRQFQILSLILDGREPLRDGFDLHMIDAAIQYFRGQNLQVVRELCVEILRDYDSRVWVGDFDDLVTQGQLAENSDIFRVLDLMRENRNPYATATMLAFALSQGGESGRARLGHILFDRFPELRTIGGQQLAMEVLVGMLRSSPANSPRALARLDQSALEALVANVAQAIENNPYFRTGTISNVRLASEWRGDRTNHVYHYRLSGGAGLSYQFSVVLPPAVAQVLAAEAPSSGALSGWVDGLTGTPAAVTFQPPIAPTNVVIGPLPPSSVSTAPALPPPPPPSLRLPGR